MVIFGLILTVAGIAPMILGFAETPINWALAGSGIAATLVGLLILAIRFGIVQAFGEILEAIIEGIIKGL